MWIPQAITSQVDDVADIFYEGGDQCRKWNARRLPDEVRMFSGWCWRSKDATYYRQGLKTLSACYRDAFYTLVSDKPVPLETRKRLRVVKAA